MLQPVGLDRAFFGVFSRWRELAVLLKSVHSRCGKAAMYLDLTSMERILFNDWYIFTPATSNAVIIHTDCNQ